MGTIILQSERWNSTAGLYSPSSLPRSLTHSHPPPRPPSSYSRSPSITAWLSWQVFQNPSLAELVELGTTYQEKVIQGIRIGRDGGRGKREVVIVGGSHGREVRWRDVRLCDAKQRKG